MKQTLTLLEVLNALPSLKILANQKGMKGTTIYKLGKNVEAIEREAAVIDNTRRALFEKYAVGAGDDRKIPEDKQAEANAELDEFLHDTVEIEVRQVSPDDLVCEEITVAVLLPVLWMIKDEVQDAAPVPGR